MNSSKWNQLNAAVYAPNTDIVKIDSNDIALLKEKVMETPDKRIRVCAHENAASCLHEMLIVMAKGSYIRPHKHKNKSESFHIIEGLLDVIVFDEVGNILDTIPMGNPESGKNFFYRLLAPYFHTLLLRTELVVFHETTNGPFQKADTVYAPWSPNQVEIENVNKYLLALESRVSKSNFSNNEVAKKCSFQSAGK